MQMARLSADQQLQVLSDSILQEITKLKTLPIEEAKDLARRNLYNAGIVDKEGKYTEPYIALKG